MNNQKRVEIIGFEAGNYNTIKVVRLTPDILSKKFIQVVGESGAGKSSLLELLKIPISGTDAIKKKTILEKGFFTQAQLLDGDLNVYIGARVSEYQRGEKSGDPKFEFYLYSLDENGKQYQPIIDGVAATASEYTKLLTTDLTFKMADMFSENQTIHRKLIESLFSNELKAMKADELVASIERKKTERDSTRMLCQSQGAYMERFKEEGLDEESLKMIVPVDIVEIDKKITELLLKKDRLERSGKDAHDLAIMRIDRERDRKIQELKDEGNRLVEELRKDRQAKDDAHARAMKKYEEAQAQYISEKEKGQEIIGLVQAYFVHPSDSVVKAINEEMMYKLKLIDTKEPVREPDDKVLLDKIKTLRDKVENFPAPVYPQIEAVDTTAIDKEIAVLNDQKVSAAKTNSLHNRYKLWLSWIEAKARYESELDKLRKLYASINTGVDGLSIVPTETDSGKIEVWLMYNGCYDPDFFHNENLEMRHLFAYSSFQRSVIGVILQSARLDLKKKALRLAIVDDVAFTEKGIQILSDLCEKFNIKLIAGRTIAPTVDSLDSSQILVDGGEIFFNNDTN